MHIISLQNHLEDLKYLGNNNIILFLRIVHICSIGFILGELEGNFITTNPCCSRKLWVICVVWVDALSCWNIASKTSFSENVFKMKGTRCSWRSWTYVRAVCVPWRGTKGPLKQSAKHPQSMSDTVFFAFILTCSDKHLSHSPSRRNTQTPMTLSPFSTDTSSVKTTKPQSFMKLLHSITHCNLSLIILWIIFAQSLALHFRIWFNYNYLWSVLIEIFKLWNSRRLLYWIRGWVIVVSHNSRSYVLIITWDRPECGRFSCVLNCWLWYFEFLCYFVLILIFFVKSKYFFFLQIC
jgi:hypothetical protein